MLATLIVIAVACAGTAFEVTALIRKRWVKETVVYSVLLLLGCFLSTAAVRSWNLPSPLSLLVLVYKPVSDWLIQLANFFPS